MSDISNRSLTSSLPKLLSDSSEEDAEIVQQHEEMTLGNDSEFEGFRGKRLRNESDSGERYEDDDGFTTVSRNAKRFNRSLSKSSDPKKIATDMMNKYEVCITSIEPLPKQIALAKMLRKHNVDDIKRIKYKSSFKVLILFNCQEKADVLLKCKAIADLGLRCQMTFELNLCYGILKQMDLEIDIKELHNSLKCDYEIISLIRLKRLNEEGVWIESETIRIGFKSSTLPPYVYGYGCRFKVEPYTFPVSQCSGCWKYGHIRKYCPKNKVFCPKCGQNHVNCETKDYKCLNCGGPHMSLDKTCPIFYKEKQIRDIMSKETCSYRKALIIYHKNKHTQENETVIVSKYTLDKVHTRTKTYRDVLTHSEMNTSTCHEQENNPEKDSISLKDDNRGQTQGSNKKKKNGESRIGKHKKERVEIHGQNKTSTSGNSENDKIETQRSESRPTFSFVRLMQKFKDIIMSNTAFEDKVKSFCNIAISEIFSYVVEMMKDGNILNNFLYSLSNGY